MVKMIIEGKEVSTVEGVERERVKKKRLSERYAYAMQGLKKVGERLNKIQRPFTRFGERIIKEPAQPKSKSKSKSKPKISTGAFRAIARAFERATIQQKPRAVRRPIRRVKKTSSIAMKQKMARVRAAKRTQPRQQTAVQPTQKGLPNSVAGLYNHPNVRELLPQHELDRINSMPRNFQRQAAINYLTPKIKQQELEMKRERENVARTSFPVEQRIEIDFLSGKPRLITLRRKKDAWLSS